jgi:hypothetical protein
LPLSKLLEEERCLLKRVGCDLKTNDDVKKLSSEVKKIHDEKSQIEKRIAELKERVGEVNAGNLQAIIDDHKELVDKCQSAFLDAHGIAETLKNLNEVGKAPSSATVHAVPVLKPEGAQDTLLQNRESDKNFAGFVDTFRRVVSQLISPAAAAVLNANPNSIHDLMGENEDLGSKESLMKLWAFDFATLVRSIEAPVFLPGLLIHDSPKQEDLADEEYWGLFTLARLLEPGDQGNALFQYIITTSTPPPVELQDKDHVRLHLAPGRNTSLNPDTDEEEDDGYLFRCRF